MAGLKKCSRRLLAELQNPGELQPRKRASRLVSGDHPHLALCWRRISPTTGSDVMQAAPLQPDLARTSPDHNMAGWFFGAGAISQAVAAAVLVKKGDGGARMPGRAFAISTLAVGTIACATGLCLHQLGMRQVKDWVLLGNMLRNNLRGTALTHVPIEASGTMPAGGNAEECKSK
eukprot:SM000040S14817  [mRNA]  locus=s40:515845:517366:- [translate_table: standard]